AGGVGGAPGRHADDGADPQPGHDDARRRARAGFGRHVEGGRAVGRRRARPPRTGAPDRRAGGAPHVLVGHGARGRGAGDVHPAQRYATIATRRACTRGWSWSAWSRTASRSPTRTTRGCSTSWASNTATLQLISDFARGAL